MKLFRKTWELLGDVFGYRNGEFVRIYGGRETESGELVTQESSMQVVALYRCATLIAGSAASLPIDVYTKGINGVRQPAMNHPIETLLDSQPNPEMSSMDFRSQQWLSLLLWGNSFAKMERDGNRVIALWPLMPQYMKIKRQDSGARELIYEYSVPGIKPYPFLAQEILHVREFSMDGITGISRIAKAANMIGLHRSTEKSASKFFKNGAQLNQQLKIPGTIPQKVVNQLREDFESEYSGTSNHHKVFIAHSGSEMAAIGVNPKDAQFIEQREFNDVQVCMLMGVPPHMIGLTSRSTSWGTGIAEQKQGFLDFTVSPLLTFHEKAYERCLLSDTEQRTYIKHNTNAFLRADIQKRFEAYVSAVDHGIMSRNEVRELEEKGPCEGGDIHTVQMQYIPLDQVGKQPAVPARPGDQNG